ncbi:unnamed protein product [Closterium sp. Naga37s-1]|nr:unnamed protein product [Closterium sp. Naga37s-1]
MIRRDYRGFGIPPGPPQLPEMFHSPTCSHGKVVSGSERTGVVCGPMVPVDRGLDLVKHTRYPYVTGTSVLVMK